jgi:acyl-coenzyme A synthetase/AMP-(fatty) acid ligase/thioesterase domain-containing protein/acyl carrier protein
MQENHTRNNSDKNLLDDFWFYIRKAADQYGDKPYVQTKNGALSFRQNSHHANVIAEKLGSHFGEERFGVGLFIKDPLTIIPAMLGVMKSGLYFVPLDISFPEKTLLQMYKIGNIKYILTDDPNFQKAKVITSTGMTLINLDDLDFSKVSTDPDVPYSPADIVQIMFTSGSTGTPKGAIEDYRYLARTMMVKLSMNQYTAQDKVLQLSTFTYSAPHLTTFYAMVSGTTLYYHDLLQDGFLELPDIINRENITVYHSTVTVFRNFLRTLHPDMTFPAVRQFRFGGEKRLLEDIKAGRKHFPNAKIIDLGFASTETWAVSTASFPVDYPFDEGQIPAGFPYDDIKLMIWDKDGNELPNGEEGEIVIYGEALARGYIYNPELTEKHFIPDPENPLGQYFKTGDLGKILPDGQLLHLGRIDSMVKIKGVRIELSTLENYILGYPGIVQVASRAIEDEKGGKKLACYYVAEQGIGIPTSDLRQHLAERLPTQQLPHYLIQLEEIPMTRNGKVALTQLPLPKMIRPDLPYPFEPPVDDLEKILLNVWEEQLGITGIGVNDDFFDVGGDSLLGVVLVLAIEEALGKSFPVSMLLQAATIRQQASLIRSGNTEESYNIVLPIHPQGSLPPLFFIPGKGGYPTRIRHLSKTLDPEIPIYAMQDLLNHGDSGTAARQVKSTASLYLSEMRRISPHGPYLLIGESLGGKICYEIAQQLHAQGEDLPLIFMLDTYNFDYSLIDDFRRQNNIPYYKMLFQKHLRIWFKSDWDGKKEYIKFYKETFGKKLKRFLDRRLRKVNIKEELPKSTLLPENVKQMEREFKEASRNYVPQPYPGKVVLIKALRGPNAYNKTNGWDNVNIGKLVVHQLDCYHGSILFEPAVSQLAEIIQKYIRELYKGIATISFDNISKSYAKYTNREVAALDKISFSIKENDFVSIVGPSGCGKTTFLKIIANLIKADYR